jgi:hypothetical protein
MADDGGVLGSESLFLLLVNHLRPEELLRNHGRHERGQEHNGDQFRVLPLGDQPVGQPEECSDRPECQPGRHE